MKKIKKAAALSYDKEKDSAPKVVASGRGYMAERIIETARKNNIPTVENGWASDILCSVPMGSEIPEELYQVVAEIFAFMLKVDHEKGQELKFQENI